ncbi:multicopper oxidase family protein [Micromonospora haikouensis]|uniref:multicopper oxidase family protein n=1 Tax=Micromonospora haikouensis TaxID=686309 RepID=UPI003678E558
MVTRRRLIAAGAAGGAALLLPAGRTAAGAPTAPTALIDPRAVPKYVTPLPVPTTMPASRTSGGVDEYVVAVRQFRQQVLPAGLPATTVWGFGSPAHPRSFAYPGPTIAATVGRPVRVTWCNQLVDERGRYLPHLLPVDPTLHWANPTGGVDGRDHRPHFTSTPGPYRGPVPTVMHVHGGHNRQESDGHPEAWFLPVARDLPAGCADGGSAYSEFRDLAAERTGVRCAPGTTSMEYANDQRATTLWYHDHTLGMTRVNLYAGLAGFYRLSGGPDDLPSGALPGSLPEQASYDLPLLIQDRTFRPDGSLWYPESRADFDDYPGPYLPGTDVPPIWNPEFFAATMVVNGATWPVLRVQRRRYRFRLLNGCNARFLMLSVTDHPTRRPARPALPLWQVGSDGGFLPEPVAAPRILLANGQRADVVVDFTDVPAGTELYLVNEGPDEPFGGGAPGTDFPAADPRTTGQVLKFVVGDRAGADASVPPGQLSLPACAPLPAARVVRRLSLNEQESSAGPVRALLGVVAASGRPVPLGWDAPVTETPALGVTEEWELRNCTEDAHPIHVHQVQFQVLGRGHDGHTPPGPAERGFHDTVVVYPGQLTRIKVRFDLPGRYVWHCHLLEHEDNEMMRPIEVLPSGAAEGGDGSSRRAGAAG